MDKSVKHLTDYLLAQGVDTVAHSGKTFMGHLIGVYRLMKAAGCDEELCSAGMFHSIYGTQLFQDFKLPLERRGEVRALLGERAEKLAYLNCAMDRPSFDRAVEEGCSPYRFRNRITSEEVELSERDFDDLCRIHLYDWLEQVPRSRYGWNYRRSAFRAMADRLGGDAVAAYERTFAQEQPAIAGSTRDS